MCKEFLREDQMTGQAVVEDAQKIARLLVSRESRGPGDVDNAMRRLESRYGVPYSTLWSLRYRLPKDLLVSAYFKLVAAYEAECERQMRKLDHELAIARAKAGPHSSLVRAAARVGGKDDGAS